MCWHYVGIRHIADALKINDTLIGLDVSQNNISDKGAFYLAEALSTNRTLKTLKLSLNDWTKEGVELIKSSLIVNDSLKFIDIDEKYIEIFANLCIDSDLLAPKENRINYIFDLLQLLYATPDRGYFYNSIIKLIACVNKYKEHLDETRFEQFEQFKRNYNNLKKGITTIVDRDTNGIFPDSVLSLVL